MHLFCFNTGLIFPEPIWREGEFWGLWSLDRLSSWGRWIRRNSSPPCSCAQSSPAHTYQELCHPDCWICSSVSPWSRKALPSSFRLVREPWEEWMWSKGVTGIRAPQARLYEHGCGLVLRDFFFFFLSCLVRLSPFEPPVPFSPWPRWKGKGSWISHWAVFSSVPNVPSGYNNRHVISLEDGDLGRQSCFRPPGSLEHMERNMNGDPTCNLIQACYIHTSPRCTVRNTELCCCQADLSRPRRLKHLPHTLACGNRILSKGNKSPFCPPKWLQTSMKWHFDFNFFNSVRAWALAWCSLLQFPLQRRLEILARCQGGLTTKMILVPSPPCSLEPTPCLGGWGSCIEAD